MLILKNTQRRQQGHGPDHLASRAVEDSGERARLLFA